MNGRDRVATALLALRLGVFLVMMMWTLDKFLNVGHASRIFESFYAVGGVGQMAFAAIGAAELVLILAFVAGVSETRVLWTGADSPRSFNALVLPPVSGSLQQPLG